MDDGHLHATRAEPALVSHETAAFLYRPRSENGYALGWLTLAAGAEGNADGLACDGPVVLHNGGNGSFYAFIWLAPVRNVAIVVATNADGDRPRQAVGEAIGTLAGFAPACPAVVSR